jgi:hypothetical protein
MSVATIEYRLDTLETVLAEFIMQQNRNLTRLEREMSDFKNEMSDFKNEMKISQDKMSEDVKKYQEEGRLGRREMNKKWGEVTNKLGTFAEDFVAPNIPRIATEFFKFPLIDIFNRREDRRNPQDASQVFEFDVFVVCHSIKKIILTDVKFSVRMVYLESVPKTIENFRIAFPEYAEYEVITIFASMAIAPDQVKYLTKMGVYALALGDENMDLLNFENLNQ